MDSTMELAREALKTSGYKTSYVAGQIGVDQSTVSRFKGGKTKLGKPALILLCLLLNLNAEDLRQSAS